MSVSHLSPSTPPHAGAGRLVFFLLLFSFSIPGCAPGFTGSSPEDFGSFRIDVTNDLAPRVVVYLQEFPEAVPDAGNEEGALLGNAPVEGTTTFRVDLERASTPHRLRALLPRDVELYSETFVPSELAGVEWTMADNVLTREERDGRDAASTGEEAGETEGFRRPGGSDRYPPRP